MAALVPTILRKYMYVMDVILKKGAYVPGIALEHHETNTTKNLKKIFKNLF